MARSIFDKSEWDFFWRFWDEAIQRIPDLKREALEAMGKAVLQEVRGQISRRGVNDPQGRWPAGRRCVWQQRRLWWPFRRPRMKPSSDPFRGKDNVQRRDALPGAGPWDPHTQRTDPALCAQDLQSQDIRPRTDVLQLGQAGRREDRPRGSQPGHGPADRPVCGLPGGGMRR